MTIGKTPCKHCGSLARLANGQCRCRTRAYREGRVATKDRRTEPVENRADPAEETGVVTVSTSTAASFVAWVPRSEIPLVSLELRRASEDAVQLTVAPALAWSLFNRKYGRP